jgi:transposase
MTVVDQLMDGLRPQHVIADKGYDSDPLRNLIRTLGPPFTNYKINNSLAFCMDQETG